MTIKQQNFIQKGKRLEELLLKYMDSLTFDQQTKILNLSSDIPLRQWTSSICKLAIHYFN